MGKKTTRRRERKKIYVYRLILVVMLVIATLPLLSQWGDRVFGEAALTKTAVFVHGEIHTTGVLCFTEYLTYAPCPGEVQRQTSQGGKIAKGESGAAILATVTDLSDDEMKMTLPAQVAGIISYEFDGLETVLTPQNLEKIDLAAVLASSDNYQTKTSKGIVGRGEGVYKTIDNKDHPLLGLHIPTDALKFEPRVGSVLSLQVAGKKTEGEIIMVREAAQNWELFLVLPVEDLWLQYRYVPVVFFAES